MSKQNEQYIAKAIKQITKKQYEQWDKMEKARKEFLIRAKILLKGAFNNLQHAKDNAINPNEKKELNKEIERLINDIAQIDNIIKKYE